MSTNLEGSIQEEEEISLVSKAKGEISFIQHNAGKRQEVQQTLLEIGFKRKTDIILVQEPSTWKDRQKGSYFSILYPAFNLILPSNLAIHPRVAVYIRKTSSSFLQYRNREDICKDTDIIVLEIYGQLKRFLLFNIYNKKQLDENSGTQRNSRTTISRAIIELEIDLPFILIGDYNLHHTQWNALARNPSKEAEELVDWLDKNNCQLLNSDKQEGTFYRSNIRGKSVIDLAFYSGNFQENTWDNWTIIEETGSNHKTIAFSLFTRETPRYLNPLQETPFSIKNTNWELFSTSLIKQTQELELKAKILVLEELIGENPYIEIGEKGPLASLEDSYRLRDRSLSILVDNLVIDLTSCIKLVVEKAILRSKTCEFSKLWWNKELLKKRQKMAKLGRLQEEQPTRSSRLEACKEAKNQYFHAIREAKTTCWNSFLEKAQGKEVFTALK